MSIFTRPESPPPRQPSPDILYTPLPSPHLRARLRSQASQQSMSSYSPSTPPGLDPKKSLLAVRSYDHLNQAAHRNPHGHGHNTARRTRSNLTLSPPATPHFLQLPTSAVPVPHRRCISNTVPYRSPPPSPIISSPPPPVPPIPAFILASSPDSKTIPHIRSTTITPIHLPVLGNLSSLTESTNISRKPNPPSPGKHRLGVTCLKFFSLRNSKRKAIPTSAA